jgi:hypothetical protein
MSELKEKLEGIVPGVLEALYLDNDLLVEVLSQFSLVSIHKLRAATADALISKSNAKTETI